MILSNRFSEALTYAAELHATQGSKGSGVSYSAHLLGTASIALEYGANEDEAISALLHSGDRTSRWRHHPQSHPPPMQGIPSQRL
jgi:(p)ppGpp synthase/HD superfamily hydrolase